MSVDSHSCIQPAWGERRLPDTYRVFQSTPRLQTKVDKAVAVLNDDRVFSSNALILRYLRKCFFLCNWRNQRYIYFITVRISSQPYIHVQLRSQKLTLEKCIRIKINVIFITCWLMSYQDNFIYVKYLKVNLQPLHYVHIYKVGQKQSLYWKTL